MKLRWALFAKNMHPHAQLRNKLQQKIRKLEKHLEHFPEEAVHLQVNLEKHPKKESFAAGLTLRLPSNTLRAQKQALDPIPAFDQAVKALLREVSILKSALRHKNDWRPGPESGLPLRSALRANAAV